MFVRLSWYEFKTTNIKTYENWHIIIQDQDKIFVTIDLWRPNGPFLKNHMCMLFKSILKQKMVRNYQFLKGKKNTVK